MFEQGGDVLGEAGNAHVEDERPRETGERLPVEQMGTFLGLLVSRHEGNRTGVKPVRQWNGGTGRCGQGGGDPRHDFVADPCLSQSERLLAAAPEHERVSTFETHNAFPLPGRVDEHPFDFGNTLQVTGGQLVDTNSLRQRRGELKHWFGHQLVVDDQIGLRQTLERADREQSGVAGSAPTRKT